jgi:hypothetical protein
MAPKSSLIQWQTDDATRLRNNQRRSRARQKDLLKHLQARVEHYESVGIRATQEMQRAARKVASENKRLWMLLRYYGVTDAEINCYLQDFERTQGFHRPNAKDVVAPLKEEQPTCPVTAATEHISLRPQIMVPGGEPLQAWYDWNTTFTVSQSSSLAWTPTLCTTTLQVAPTETEKIFQQTFEYPTFLQPPANDQSRTLADNDFQYG